MVRSSSESEKSGAASSTSASAGGKTPSSSDTEADKASSSDTEADKASSSDAEPDKASVVSAGGATSADSDAEPNKSSGASAGGKTPADSGSESDKETNGGKSSRDSASAGGKTPADSGSESGKETSGGETSGDESNSSTDGKTSGHSDAYSVYGLLDASSRSKSRSKSGGSDSETGKGRQSHPKLLAQLKKAPLQLESRAEHRDRHPNPSDFPKCPQCMYLVNKTNIEKQCTFEHPQTGELVVWAMEQPNTLKAEWGLGCCVCRWAENKTPFGACTVRSLSMISRPSKLARHANTKDHKDAVAEFVARGQGKEISDVKELETSIGLAHVVSLLQSIHKKESMLEWSEWVKVLRECGADIPHGMDSTTVGVKLLSVCAGLENYITGEVLRNAPYIGLAQDGWDGFLLMVARGMLWQRPPSLMPFLSKGNLRGIESILPEGGPPFKFQRMLGAAKLGRDRSAKKQSECCLGQIVAKFRWDCNSKHLCFFISTGSQRITFVVV